MGIVMKANEMKCSKTQTLKLAEEDSNKAILMSIKPKWNVLILNDIKKIEVRSKFCYKWAIEQIEKFGGFWIYDYCTKAKPYLIPKSESNKAFWEEKVIDIDTALNGKVVARFWCDKVEEIEHYPYEAPEHPRGYQIAYDTQTTNWDKLCEMSCLSRDELFDYLGRNNGYAIHISKLEVFDKPKELKEFYPDRNVLLVSHGGALRGLNAFFEGIPENGLLPQTWLKNCELRCYEF